jgi:hypothetical protein
MAIYLITASNWNDPAFWATIVETGNGHTLDFSRLGSAFTISFDERAGRITIRDAGDVFTVGQAGVTGTNATLGGDTLLRFFDCVIASGERELETTNDSPCFTETTLIKTRRGEVPAAQLLIGDMVLTRNHGYQPIRWIGSRRLDSAELAETPDLYPVLIRAEALGVNTPERDLIVSPQHRMLVSGARAQLWFGEDEVFVAALHLDCLDGVQQIRPEDVTYVHIMFDSHQIISGDGAWSESYQPGDPTLTGIDDDQRAELFRIFPALLNGVARETYPAARVTLKRQEVPLLFA